MGIIEIVIRVSGAVILFAIAFGIVSSLLSSVVNEIVEKIEDIARKKRKKRADERIEHLNKIKKENDIRVYELIGITFEKLTKYFQEKLSIPSDVDFSKESSLWTYEKYIKWRYNAMESPLVEAVNLNKHDPDKLLYTPVIIHSNEMEELKKLTNLTKRELNDYISAFVISYDGTDIGYIIDRSEYSSFGLNQIEDGVLTERIIADILRFSKCDKILVSDITKTLLREDIWCFKSIDMQLSRVNGSNPPTYIMKRGNYVDERCPRIHFGKYSHFPVEIMIK